MKYTLAKLYVHVKVRSSELWKY